MESIPRIREANQTLIEALEAHSLFQSQAGARIGKVYFMWDFAKRNDTISDVLIAGVLPPDTPATRESMPNAPPSALTDQQKNGLIRNAIGRCLVCFNTTMDVYQ